MSVLSSARDLHCVIAVRLSHLFLFCNLSPSCYSHRYVSVLQYDSKRIRKLSDKLVGSIMAECPMVIRNGDVRHTYPGVMALRCRCYGCRAGFCVRSINWVISFLCCCLVRNCENREYYMIIPKYIETAQ